MAGPTVATDNPDGKARNKPVDGTKKEIGPGYVSGNLTFDPELRYTPNGDAVTTLRVAYAPRVKDPESGRWGDGETEYYQVECWRALAERAAEHLLKGDRIVAVGTWYTRTWADKEGKPRETTELRATELGPSMVFAPAMPIRRRAQREAE